MNDVVKKSLEIAQACASILGMKIISVDFAREYNRRILRIIADKEEIDFDEGLTIDEVSALNEAISMRLDEEDYIKEEYYLEVSSVGIERELKTEEEIIKGIKRYVYIKLFDKMEVSSTNNKSFIGKEIYGDLIDYKNDILTIECKKKNIKNIIEIPKNKISIIRLAVKF